MKKRIIALFVTLTLIFSIFINTAVTAVYQKFDDSMKDLYDAESYYDVVWSRYNGYMNNSVWPYLSNRSNHVYTQFADKIENDAWFRAAVDFASWMTNRNATEDKYMDVVINMMALMDYELNDAMNHQTEADTLKKFGDYAMDAGKIVLDAASIDSALGERLNKIATWAKTGLDIVDLGIKDREDYKRLEKILKNYELYEGFLTAIITYSSDSKLVSAAKTIKEGTDMALILKIKQFGKSAGKAVVFTGKDIFFDNIVVEHLKNPKNWSTPDKNFGPKIFAAYDVVKTGWDIAKGLGVFAGDMLVGSSDMFNRVTEMRILSSIFDAIVKDMNKNKPAAHRNNFEAIDRAYNNMRYLTYLNARGEYCLYNMVQYEAQLLSLLFNDRKAAESWYKRVKEFHYMRVDLMDTFFPEIEDFLFDYDTYHRQELEELLGQKTSEPILSFDYYDYDSDGIKEAFAFAGTAGDDSDVDPIIGELWFINDTGAQKVSDTDGYWRINEIHTFGEYTFAVLSKWFATGDLAYIYGVRNGEPYKENISGCGGGFCQTDDVNFTMTHSAYDGIFDAGLGFSIGHTWKNYYFYWDGQTTSFKEYGGLKITEEQLLQCSGAKAILDEIKAAGNIIGNIYYRANNIININYSESDNYGVSYKNATLILENGSVRLKRIYDWSDSDLENSSYGGIYEAALISAIAVYPDSFPARKQLGVTGNQYNKDRDIYTQYLLNGGYEFLFLGFDKNNLEIASCMVDINNDGTYELLISLTNTEYPGPRGYPNVTVLLGIENDTVKTFVSSEFGGGTMGGDYLEIKYDTQEMKHILALDGHIRDGNMQTWTYHNFYSYSGGTFDISIKMGRCHIIMESGIPDYEDQITAVRNETPFHYEGDFGWHYFYYHTINGEYVSEEEYNAYGRFIEPVDDAYKLHPGTYNNPIP